ncbi:MAG: hypothetical protein RDU89_06890 [bacterium]|nr:hypothetical protein [bacterium]
MPQVRVDVDYCIPCGAYVTEGKCPVCGAGDSLRDRARTVVDVTVPADMVIRSGQLRDAWHRIQLRGGLVAARALELAMRRTQGGDACGQAD